MFAQPQLRLIFLSLFVSSVLFPMEKPMERTTKSTSKNKENKRKQEAYVSSASSEDEVCENNQTPLNSPAVANDTKKPSYPHTNNTQRRNIPVARQTGASCGYHSVLNSVLSLPGVNKNAENEINFKFATEIGTWRSCIIKMRKKALVKKYIKFILHQCIIPDRQEEEIRTLNDTEKRALDRIANAYATAFVLDETLNILKENPKNLEERLQDLVKRDHPHIEDQEIQNISRCIQLLDLNTSPITIAPAHELIKQACRYFDVSNLDLHGDNLDTTEMEVLKNLALKEYGIKDDCITIIDNTNKLNTEAYQDILKSAKKQMLKNNCTHSFCIRTSANTNHKQQTLEQLHTDTTTTHWISVTLDRKNGQNNYSIKNSTDRDYTYHLNVTQLIKALEPKHSAKADPVNINSKNKENNQPKEHVDSASSTDDEFLDSLKSNIKSNFEPFEPKVSVNCSQEPNSCKKNSVNELYCGTPIDKLEEIFEVAPPEAQDIVNMLNYPHRFYVGGCRVACLTGPPGGGKSTLLKAIAYKAGWDCKFIVPIDVKREGRGATAIQLKKMLMDIVNSKKKTVIGLDELNRLLENYNSEHHDTDETGDTLWTFLDDQMYNESIFVIATMNRANKIPPQLQSRTPLCKEIPSLISTSLQNILIKNLTRNSAQLHEECTPGFVGELLLPFKTCSGRDIESIAASAIRLSRRNNLSSTIAIISKTHLEEAISNLIHVQNDIYKMEEKEDETEAERQERHHKENLDKQDMIFVQGIFLQLTTKSLDRSEQVNVSTNDSINIGLNPALNLGTNKGTSVTRQIVKTSDYEKVKEKMTNNQVRLLNALLEEAKIRVEAETQQKEQAQQIQLNQGPQDQPVQPNQPAQTQAQGMPQDPQAHQHQQEQQIPNNNSLGERIVTLLAHGVETVIITEVASMTRLAQDAKTAKEYCAIQ